MKQSIIRITKLLSGIFLYGFGIYLVVYADIGVAPWDTLTLGILGVTGFQFGNIVVVTGIVLLVIVSIMKEKIGIGTIINTLTVGKVVDLFRWLKPFPACPNLFVSILVVLLGELVISIATYLYMSPGLGGGPRDLLMVAVGKRFPRVPVGVIRGVIEGSVLLTGFLLGAKVGVGTVVAVIGISVLLQYTLKFFKFDIKAVEHEDLFATIRRVRRMFVKSPAAVSDDADGGTGTP